MSLVEVEAKLPLLAEPFPSDEVKWKPQSVKGNRALAVAYIDARLVQDRLDEVVGPGNWQDSYDVLPDGHTILCRLAIRVGDDWLIKQDVGSPSEQPDAGDRMKAAFSDALKRAAVKWGIGRYLYSLPHQWADYDPAKKQFARTPGLPDWAKPKKELKQATVQELKGQMAATKIDQSKRIDEVQVKKLLDTMTAAKVGIPAMLAKFSVADLKELDQEQFHIAMGLLKQRQDALNAPQAAKA